MPVFKKDNDTDKICYRPVSIRLFLKFMRKVSFDQTYEEFGTKSSSCLCGYLKGHSCCTALLKMTEDWRTCLDIREALSTVALDQSKAFDSASHCL